MMETSTVADRRLLRFETLDQVLAEAEKLVALDRAGHVRCLGNWSLGQILGHLAYWTNVAFDGTPLKPPFFIRMLLKMMRKRFLNGPMRAGVKIPGIKDGTLGVEPLPVDEGMRRLRLAIGRLQAGVPNQPNAIFGPMPKEDWVKLNLRHAELHLGFVIEC